MFHTQMKVISGHRVSLGYSITCGKTKQKCCQIKTDSPVWNWELLCEDGPFPLRSAYKLQSKSLINDLLQINDQSQELWTGVSETKSQLFDQRKELWTGIAELAVTMPLSTSRSTGKGCRIVARFPRELVQCQVLGTNHRTRVNFP